MNELITIGNQQITIKEFNNQRVVTFNDIDLVHERPKGTAGRNFRANRKRFVESEDFFLVKPHDIQTDEIRRSEINNSGTYLITEQGYLMLVKSFTDDLAWKVQRQLVNTYFRARKPISALEALAQTVQALQEQNSRILSLETTQHAIKEAVISEPDNWREDINKKMNLIAQRIGNNQYREIRSESYKLLEQRAGVLLDRRLDNKKIRMLKEGATKTAINNVRKIDIIDEDKKLREIYGKIVSEYLIKYVA